MWINTHTNEIIYHSRPMTINGTSVPAKIFEDQEALLALGVKPYSEEFFDGRYYTKGELTLTDNGDSVVGSYEKIPLSLESLKNTALHWCKVGQATELQEIDWYWLREMKTGTPVPQNIKDQATACYAKWAAKEAEIEAATTVEDFIALENPEPTLPSEQYGE